MSTHVDPLLPVSVGCAEMHLAVDWVTTNVNWSAELVALVPAWLVTVTSTVPPA